jgi:hypothetical protein
MKRKNTFLNLAMVGLIAVLLHLPAMVIAGGGPGPGVAGFRQSGPNLKGVIFAGWLENMNENGLDTTYGTVEVFLHIDDKLYVGIIDTDNPESEFLGTVEADVITWPLPEQIAIDYEMPEGTKVAILSVDDVSDFDVEEEVELDTKTSNEDVLSYKHVLHCEVKVSFLVPVKKPKP